MVGTNETVGTGDGAGVGVGVGIADGGSATIQPVLQSLHIVDVSVAPLIFSALFRKQVVGLVVGKFVGQTVHVMHPSVARHSEQQSSMHVSSVVVISLIAAQPTPVEYEQ